MRTPFSNKSLTPNDVPSGWGKPKKTQPQPASAVPPRFNLQAALKPDAIRENIARHFAHMEGPLQQQMDRSTAQLELAKLDLHRRELEVRASGGNPDLDEGIRRLQFQVADLEAQVTAIRNQIAARREQAKVLTETAPGLLADYAAKAAATLQAFAEVKPLFDQLEPLARQIETTLRDMDPNTGRSYLVGLRVPNGSILGVFQALEPTFGQNASNGGGSELRRVLREARDLGFEVE